jgi:hypothetical protein
MAFNAYKDHDEDEETEPVPIGQPPRIYLTADLRKHVLHVYGPDAKTEIGVIERFDFPALFDLILTSSTPEQMKRYVREFKKRAEYNTG